MGSFLSTFAPVASTDTELRDTTRQLSVPSADTELRDTMRQLSARLANRCEPTIRTFLIGDLANVIVQYAIDPIETFIKSIDGRSFSTIIGRYDVIVAEFTFNRIKARGIVIGIKLRYGYRHSHELKMSRRTLIRSIEGLSFGTIIRRKLTKLANRIDTVRRLPYNEIRKACDYVINRLNDYLTEAILRE